MCFEAMNSTGLAPNDLVAVSGDGIAAAGGGSSTTAGGVTIKPWITVPSGAFLASTKASTSGASSCESRMSSVSVADSANDTDARTNRLRLRASSAADNAAGDADFEAVGVSGVVLDVVDDAGFDDVAVTVDAAAAAAAAEAEESASSTRMPCSRLYLSQSNVEPDELV